MDCLSLGKKPSSLSVTGSIRKKKKDSCLMSQVYGEECESSCTFIFEPDCPAIMLVQYLYTVNNTVSQYIGYGNSHVQLQICSRGEARPLL